MFPRDAELRFREGVLLHELGRLGKPGAPSSTCWRRARSGISPAWIAASPDSRRGRTWRWSPAIWATWSRPRSSGGGLSRRCPAIAPAGAAWARRSIRRCRFAEAEALVERLLDDNSLRVEGWLLKSRIALRLFAWDDVRTALDRAGTEYPDDPEILNRRCQFLFEFGPTGDAEEALKKPHRP